MIVVQGPNMSGRLNEFEGLPLNLTANPNALKITFSVDKLDVLAVLSELVPVKSFLDLNESVQSEPNQCKSMPQNNPYPVAYERSLKVYLVDSDQDYLISPARCVFVNIYQFDANEELISIQSMLVDPEFWKNPFYNVPDSISMAIRDIILSVMILAEISLNALLAELHEISVAEDYDLWEDDVDIYDLIDQLGLDEQSKIESEDDLAEIISWFWFMETQLDEEAQHHQDDSFDKYYYNNPDRMHDYDSHLDDSQIDLDDGEEYYE